MEQLLVFVRFFRFLQDLIVKRLQIALQAGQVKFDGQYSLKRE